MAHVLTTGSTLTCGPALPASHGGSLHPAPGAAKLTISGSPVLRSSDVVGQTVTGCHTPTSATPTKPCHTVSSVTSGLAVKVTVGGVAVLLDTLAGVTDGVPSGTLACDAAQLKLTTG